MSDTPKTPKPHKQRRQGSALSRLKRFFEDNPGEELTYEDVMTKFDVPRRSAVQRVRDATKEGWLRCEVVIRFNPPTKENP